MHVEENCYKSFVRNAGVRHQKQLHVMTLIHHYADNGRQILSQSLLKNVPQMPTCLAFMILSYINVYNSDRFRLLLRHEFLSNKYANGTRSQGGYMRNLGGFELIPDLLINVQENEVNIEFLRPEKTRTLFHPGESDACACGMTEHYVEFQFRFKKRWKSVASCTSLYLENFHFSLAGGLCLYRDWQMAEKGLLIPVPLRERGTVEWFVQKDTVFKLRFGLAR
jgi:hypothetical protein